MSFGVICLLQEANIGSVQSRYIRIYKKNWGIIFPFLKKKHRKKITQSISNLNAYPSESNGKVLT